MKLVSAIMPTRARREFAAKALQCFLNQTYIEKELVVLDDASDPSFPEGISMPAVTYKSVTERWNIGKKRNEACRLAKGELICHFDSDDWSEPDRIASQVRLMEQYGLAVCGYYSILFVDEGARKAWKYQSSATHCLGTSLMFTAAWWAEHRFPEKTVGEDYAMVMLARKWRQVISVAGDNRIVARVHLGPNGNTSRKSLKLPNYRPIDWSQVPEGFRN